MIVFKRNIAYVIMGVLKFVIWFLIPYADHNMIIIYRSTLIELLYFFSFDKFVKKKFSLF